MSALKRAAAQCASLIALVACLHVAALAAESPNILLVISDDQSWPHAGAYGDKTVETPAFDRIAEQGVLFTNAFCPASQCSPSRAALLTGLNIWQLEEAGTHASLFPTKFTVYTDLLEAKGYAIGYTGKPWAPGSWKDSNRPRNPAGTEFNDKTLVPPSRFISQTDYAGNFQEFLDRKQPNAPFHFWVGCREPHRDYDPGSGQRSGKIPASVDIPRFWPDDAAIRSDFLDYKLEIDWFDQQLAKCIDILEQAGELENTLIVVTSDNGMPFPRAKATLYDAGTRIPLAMQWPKGIEGGRVIDDLVSLIDLAPTLVEATGAGSLDGVAGQSLMPLLNSTQSGILDTSRAFVLMGKERHNYARPDNVGYPSRAIRNRQYLYIRNYKPDRWPMGDPPYYLCHTKMANPTKDFILSNAENPVLSFIYRLAYEKRPAEELYDVVNDPDCIRNLATTPENEGIRAALARKLDALLLEQKDPRSLGRGDVFESYPYYQRLPELGFPGFKEYGKYNPQFTPPVRE